MAETADYIWSSCVDPHLTSSTGSRRRSLSPMALSASLQNAAFGGGSSSSIASGATDILRGTVGGGD